MKEASLLDYNKKGSTSWQQGRLISLRHKFIKGLKQGVGDEKSIKFWEDNWVINQPLFSLARNKERIDKSISVNSFINSNGEWNRTKIQHEFATHLNQDIINKIIRILIPKNVCDDRLYWSPSKKMKISQLNILLK